MKKQFILTFLFAVLIIESGYAQIKDTEAFLKEVFASLRNQDQARFVKLYPDKERFTKILLSMMKAYSGTDTAAINKGMAMFGEISDSSLYKQFSQEYEKAMEQGSSANVNWKEAIFTSYKADTVDANELKGRQLRGKIYFTSTGTDYFLSFDEVLWPDDDPGWYGIAIRTVNEKSLEAADTYEADTVDSVAMPIDPETEQKIRNKPPTKKNMKPANNKTKSKSPGNKPD